MPQHCKSTLAKQHRSHFMPTCSPLLSLSHLQVLTNLKHPLLVFSTASQLAEDRLLTANEVILCSLGYQNPCFWNTLHRLSLSMTYPRKGSRVQTEGTELQVSTPRTEGYEGQGKFPGQRHEVTQWQYHKAVFHPKQCWLQNFLLPQINMSYIKIRQKYKRNNQPVKPPKCFFQNPQITEVSGFSYNNTHLRTPDVSEWIQLAPHKKHWQSCRVSLVTLRQDNCLDRYNSSCQGYHQNLLWIGKTFLKGLFLHCGENQAFVDVHHSTRCAKPRPCPNSLLLLYLTLSSLFQIAFLTINSSLVGKKPGMDRSATSTGSKLGLQLIQLAGSD